MATPASAVPIFTAFFVIAAGVVTVLVSNPRVGIALIAAGVVIEFCGVWVHDWVHRRYGEAPHAMSSARNNRRAQ